MNQYLSLDRLTSHYPNLQVFMPVWVPQAILFNSIATSVVAADKQPVEQVLYPACLQILDLQGAKWALLVVG